MRFKHWDRRAHGSAEEAHPKVQTEVSDRSLSRHVSDPRKRKPVEVSTLLFSVGATGFASSVLGLTGPVCEKYSYKIMSPSSFENAGVRRTL